MTSFRRKRGTYKVQEDPETPNKASKKKMMTCFVDLLDDNTMNIEIEVNKCIACFNYNYENLKLSRHVN